jgi:hypothetical protein
VPTFLTLFAFQGSKLTDLDLQFSSSQKEVHVTIDNIKETVANVKKQKVGLGLVSKLKDKRQIVNLLLREQLGNVKSVRKSIDISLFG